MAKKDAEIQTLRNKIGEMQKELKEKDQILDMIRSIIS